MMFADIIDPLYNSSHNWYTTFHVPPISVAIAIPFRGEEEVDYGDEERIEADYLEYRKLYYTVHNNDVARAA